MIKFFLLIILITSCNQQPGELEFQDITDQESKEQDNPSLSGLQLYKTNCQSCHNSLNQSEKTQRSMISIKNAIQSVPVMNHLSQLSDDHLMKIEEALSYPPPTLRDLLPVGVLSSNTTNVTLSVQTDEEAKCRFDTSPNNYISMFGRFDIGAQGFSHQKQLNVVPGNHYRFHIRCRDKFGNDSLQDSQINFSVTASNAPDTTGPSLFSLQPNNNTQLESHITSQEITFITSEDANCRYSQNSSHTYNQMTDMGTTGARSHRQMINGLFPNTNHQFYFLCQDNLQNQSSLTSLSFSVKAINLNGESLYANNCMSCHGALDQSSKLNRSLNQISNAITGVSMMNSLSFLTNAQKSEIAKALSFQPPIINTNQSPSGVLPNTTTSIRIIATTNEVSTCRYSTTDQVFDNIPNSFVTNAQGVRHERTVQVAPGQNHHYYIRCRDNYGNKSSSSSQVQFSIAGDQDPDTKPPSITNLSHQDTSPLLTGTQNTDLSFTTSENASCRYSTNSNANYDSMTSMITTGQTSHSHSVTGLQNGVTYHYYFICQDPSGNTSTRANITFSIANPSNHNGAELYRVNCSACHNALAQSTKRPRTATQIKTAIQNIRAMQSSSLQTLTDQELDYISQALSTTTQETVDEERLDVSLRVVSRKYVAEFFKKLFNLDEQRVYIDIGTNRSFGGGCDRYAFSPLQGHPAEFTTEACPGGFGSSAHLVSVLGTIRAGLTIRYCERNLQYVDQVNLVMNKVANTHNAWNEQTFIKTYKLFYAYEEPTPQVIQSFKRVYDSALINSNQFNRTWIGWKAILIGLCVSPEWQIIR